MRTNHTPTPYYVQPIGGQRYIEAQGPKLICDMQADECQNPAEVAEMEANAAFIVRACNCHDELVQVLDLIHDLPVDDEGFRTIPPGFLNAARAVLAKARGSV